MRPFILEEIDGIGAVDIDTVTTKSIGDGVYYHGNSLDERIISINVGIRGNDKKDMFALRDKLISLLSPKNNGLLIYENDHLKRQIECRVYSGPNYSTKHRKVQKMNIQFICPSPFFTDIAGENESMAKVVANFEFPLSIDINEGIEFGVVESNPLGNVINKGDQPTGFIVEFKANGTVVNPSILNVDTREIMKVNITLEGNETLRINTNFGKKRIELIDKTGEIQNVFHKIDIESEFFQLYRGDNWLRFDADEGVNSLFVNILYDNQYWGC